MKQNKLQGIKERAASTIFPSVGSITYPIVKMRDGLNERAQNQVYHSLQLPWPTASGLQSIVLYIHAP